MGRLFCASRPRSIPLGREEDRGQRVRLPVYQREQSADERSAGVGASSRGVATRQVLLAPLSVALSVQLEMLLPLLRQVRRKHCFNFKYTVRVDSARFQAISSLFLREERLIALEAGMRYLSPAKSHLSARSRTSGRL